MAAISPWIARLVESELENIIAWKSVVKADPDGSDENAARFKDEGGNLKSFIGSPPLSQQSMVQNLQVPTPTFSMENSRTDRFSETRLERSCQDTDVRW
jgi:hypothetical protein